MLRKGTYMLLGCSYPGNVIMHCRAVTAAMYRSYPWGNCDSATDQNPIRVGYDGLVNSTFIGGRNMPNAKYMHFFLNVVNLARRITPSKCADTGAKKLSFNIGESITNVRPRCAGQECTSWVSCCIYAWRLSCIHPHGAMHALLGNGMTTHGG